MNRVAAALLVALVACAQPEQKAPAPEKAPAAKPATPPPTADEARTIIAGSPDLGEYDFTSAAYTLPMSRAAMNEPAKAAAADLKRAGWISFSGDSVVLTSKAKEDKRWLVRPNGFVDIVPLAKKEFVSIDGVQKDAEGNVAVDFTWKWIPNEIGSSFRSGPVHDRFVTPHQATATLIRSGDSWMILRIRPR